MLVPFTYLWLAPPFKFWARKLQISNAAGVTVGSAPNCKYWGAHVGISNCWGAQAWEMSNVFK